MTNQALSKLKSFLKEQKIDFFLLPNCDEFFSEYLQESEKRIEFLTGFSGSNATIIFAQNKSYFFTDGRYLLQASSQLDVAEFEIIDMTKMSVTAWINSNISKDKKLALDSKLTAAAFLKNINCGQVLLSENPVNKIWENRPKANESEVFEVPPKLAGVDSLQKRKILTQNLQADALAITKPEDLCWLLNIRGRDIQFNPLCLAYGILLKSGEVVLLLDQKRCQNVNLEQVSFIREIKQLKDKIKSIQTDLSSTNCWLYGEFVKNNFEIISKTNPIEILKAKKNSAEILAMKKSHEVDGLALTKFLFWLEKSLEKGEEIDEISVAKKLLEFRQKNKNFLYPSFATIAGFASNGAVIHYHANERTNKMIRQAQHDKSVRSNSEFVEGSLLLIDSGGQYFGEEFCGTTDVTRTIAIGKPSAEMIEDFTRVLKGHIALARAKFPYGTSGAQLDVLARNFLWLAGKDYAHGTGHGVGAFLAVHEGPASISKRSMVPLCEGMILSNEPGFYLEGKYGIRIENLVLVEKFNEEFLSFKTLTLVPLEPRLIDFKMLTYPEKKWLREYHEEIFQTLKNDLNGEEQEWLSNLCKKFSDF